MRVTIKDTLEAFALALGLMMVAIFVVGGNSTQAAPFTCSAAAMPMPEEGVCYNKLNVEGDPTGDFRLNPDWIAAFSPGSMSNGNWSGLTVTPGFSASQFGTPNKAIGNQGPGNVESVLEGVDWFNQNMTLAGQVDTINADNFSTSITAQVFYLHFGGGGMAFLFDNPISNFVVSGAGKGLSNLRAFNLGGGSSGGNPPNPVPLPAAFPLFAGGLGLLGLLGWRRKRVSAA